eukprot:8197815-Pyramimonas_sp.AAC.1
MHVARGVWRALCEAESGAGSGLPGPSGQASASSKDDAKRKKRDKILAGKHPHAGKPLEDETQLPARRG